MNLWNNAFKMLEAFHVEYDEKYLFEDLISWTYPYFTLTSLTEAGVTTSVLPMAPGGEAYNI